MSLPFFSSVLDNRYVLGIIQSGESPMTGEEMERAIQFLLEHHAKVSTDIEGLKEAQEKTTTNLESLAQTVARLAEQAEVDRREMKERFDILTEEMRDRFNKLILSNEVTRDLAERVGRLAVATSATSYGP